MKHYPKANEDVSRKPSDVLLSNIGSLDGSVDELAGRFRSFYKDAHTSLFDMMVKEAWLEQRFVYAGVRRARSGNGYGIDWAFSYFFQAIVGISQKPLTAGPFFLIIPTYFKDFFPNFSDHDPFTEPEYFKYPYKHITLDHLAYVYQLHNRMEMLDEAEKRSMNIKEFTDWAANWAFSYAYERSPVLFRGKLFPIYFMFRNAYRMKYIRDMKRKDYGRP